MASSHPFLVKVYFYAFSFSSPASLACIDREVCAAGNEPDQGTDQDWQNKKKDQNNLKLVCFQPPYHHLECCWLCNWLFIRVGRRRCIYWGKSEASSWHLNVCAELLARGLITYHPWDGVSTAVLGLYTLVAWGWNLQHSHQREKRHAQNRPHPSWNIHEKKNGNFYFQMKADPFLNLPNTELVC